MKRINVLSMAIAAAALVIAGAWMFASCGGEDEGAPGAFCANNGDCTGEGQLCDGVAKRCVKSCTEDKNCEGLAGMTTCDDTYNYCVCDGTSCEGGLECHPNWEICVPTCSDDAECNTDNGETCGSGDLCIVGGKECKENEVTDPDTGDCVLKCTDVNFEGCAEGKFCNNDTFLCESEGPDCTVDGCDEGKVCDPVSKTCLDPCTAESCPEGEECNGETGLCEPGTGGCETYEDCQYGEYCDTGYEGATEQCVAVAEDCAEYSRSESEAGAGGPIAYFAEQTGYDTTGDCADMEISAYYYDLEGDFATEGLYDHVMYIAKTGAESKTYSTVELGEGATAEEGEIIFHICKPDWATDGDKLLFYLTDSNDNAGPATCFEVWTE